MPPAIDSQKNPAPQGLGLFLFALPPPCGMRSLFLWGQRKGIRKISFANSVPGMSGLSGRSSKSKARSEWAVRKNNNMAPYLRILVLRNESE